MRLARLAPASALAAACAGAAAWLTLGTVALTESGAGAARVGLLPPLWWLAALVAAALGLAWLTRLTPDRARPLFFSAVLLLPWLPGPIPAALSAWTGPVAWLTWAAIVGAMAWAGNRTAGETGRRADALGSPATAPWVAFACAALVYGAAAWRLAPIVPGGDEPHYLVIAQSLWRDGDLKIENNHQRGDYLEYFGGPLRPDYLKRGQDGQIYSIHLPGVPALVAPALAAGGHRLVMALLALMSAAATAVAWRTAFLLTGSAAAAWFGWAATALTAPFLLLSFTVYPDGPGAAVAMLAFAALAGLHARPGRRPLWWFALGALPAVLPWFHPRFAVLAAAFGLVFAARALGERRPALAVGAFAAVPAASALGWFGYYYAIYGRPDPAAAYGHYTQMSLSRVPVGVLGLLADQQFGLLAAAPVFAVGLAGLVVLTRRHRRLALEWLAIVVPYALVTAAYHMWWGGFSSPARFVGSTLLLFSVPAAAAWAGASRAASRGTAAVALSVSLALAVLFVGAEHGAFAFNVRDAAEPWLVWLGQTADFARGAPSLFRHDAVTALAEAAIWAAALGAAWMAARSAERALRFTPGASALVLLCSFGLAAAASLSAVWQVEGAGGTAATTGQLRALDAAASGRGTRGVTISSPAIVAADDALGRLRLGADRPASLREGTILSLPRLPAGRFRLWADLADGAGLADVGLLVGRGDAPIETWRLARTSAGAAGPEFALPVGVSPVAVRWTGGDPVPVRASWLQRIRGPEPADGLTALHSRSAGRYGRVTVFAVGGVYLEPEGLWTAGDATGELVVRAAPGDEDAGFVMSAGPVETPVEITAGTFAIRTTLAPGERRELRIPARGGRAVLVRIHARQGFRPASVDRSSPDVRLLGVRLEPPAANR